MAEKSIAELLKDMNVLLDTAKKFEKDMEKLSDLSRLEENEELLDQ